jgi:hypothetical protein
MDRIYIETTIFNRYFDTDRDYVKETQQLFQNIKSGMLDAYTSAYVVDELEAAPSPKKEQMLQLITDYDIKIIEYDERAPKMADYYIQSGMLPERSRMDGIHIAIASLNNMDFIVSLNFKHINRAKTKLKLETANELLDCSCPMICTPMEIIE